MPDKYNEKLAATEIKVAALTAWQIAQVMQRKTFRLERQISLKAFAAYANIDKLVIHAHAQANLVAHELNDRFPRLQTPTRASHSDDDPALIFIGARNFET
jgi:hypothetical protein